LNEQLKEKRQRHVRFGSFGTFPKMLRGRFPLRDALTSSRKEEENKKNGIGVCREQVSALRFSVSMYTAMRFLKTNGRPCSFWDELFIHEKKKRRGERRNASVWMDVDRKQALRLIFFLVLFFFFVFKT
jgi:hypothetical protein